MRYLLKAWARNFLADQFRGQLVGHRDVLNIRDVVRFTGAPAVVEEDNDVLVTIQPRSFSLVIARLFTIFANPIAVVNPGRVTKCCLFADLVFIYRTVFLATGELTRRIQCRDIQAGDLCKLVRFWGVDELDGPRSCCPYSDLILYTCVSPGTMSAVTLLMLSAVSSVASSNHEPGVTF